MITDNTWNFIPKEFFSVDHMGETLGIGATPNSDFPGVWNIFCLIAGDVSKFICQGQDLSKVPGSSNWMAAAIGGAHQIMPGDDEMIGYKAARMSPAEFVLAIKDFKFFIPRMITGNDAIWEETLAGALERFKKHNSAVVIPVDFRRNRAH